MLYSLPPLLTLLCYASLGLLTLKKGLGAAANRLLFCISLSGTFLYLDILVLFNTDSKTLALWTSRVDHCSVVFTIPLFVHFFRVFLDIRGHKPLLHAAYAYAAALMPFAFTSGLIAEMQVHRFGYFGRGGPLYPLVGIGAASALTYCLYWLGRAVHCEADSIRKNKLKYMCLGFGVMGLLNGLNVLPILGVSIYPPGAFSFIPLGVFAVGLLRYDLLDMGVIVKKSLWYSLLTACLVGVYSLMVVIAGKWLTQFGRGDTLTVNVVLFIVVAMIFGPGKARIQQHLDRWFHRENHVYRESVRKLGRTIVSTLDVGAIARHLATTAAEHIKLSSCHLFLNSFTSAGFRRVPGVSRETSTRHRRVYPQDAPLVAYLRQHGEAVFRTKLLENGDKASVRGVLADMAAISAAMVIPMVFNERLVGFMGFGQKTSGALFTREDVDLFSTLAMQTTLAVENASSYHRLDELNKTLELRVRQRTRALQKALAEKEKTQEQLVRSESLASIGLLVAGTAHELNNPLTSAISLVQSAAEELEKDRDRADLAAEVLTDLRVAGGELERATTIIRSLLGLSRQTRSYEENVDLNAVVGDAVRVLENQFKSSVPRIALSLDSCLPRIHGNYTGLGQVVVNIVKNALQSIAGNRGRVSVTTHHDPLAGQVVFTCRDSGPGITPAVRKDMFKPFFTTKEAGSGTGLGLYICHEIVSKHNGCIHVDSNPENGTSFRVTLPVGSGNRHPCLTNPVV